MMKSRIVLAIAVTIMFLMPVGNAYALDGYDYYVPIDITNGSGAEITGRMVFTVNASGLIDGYYMQGDVGDARLVDGTTEPFMATYLSSSAASWYTDRITVPANSVVRRNLWMGNETATRDQEWIADAADTVTVTDAASLDVTGNLTISADVNIASIPAGDTYIVNKSGAYWLKVGGNDTITAGIRVGGNITFYSSTSDGEIYGSSVVSAVAARDAATGTLKDAVAAAWVGQHFAVGTYYTNRGFLFFDTSGLPDSTVVTSAAVNLYGSSDQSATDFNIQVQDGTPTYPHDPMVVGDYDKTHYSGDGGSLNTASWSVGAYNNIALNATGRGWIDMTGTTKLALRSSRDINADDQVGPEYVEFYATEQGGTANDPNLTLTYYADIEVSATIAEDTDYSVKVTYDGSDLKLYVDSVEQDSESFTSSILTNANNMTILDFDGRIDDLMIGNTSVAAPTWNLNLQFEPTQISNNTISDQSASSNDASFSLAGNPAGITVTVYELTAASVAEATAATTETVTGLFTTAPPEPTNFYPATDDWGNLPGADLLEDLTTASGSEASERIPLDFIWLATIAFGLVAIGYFIYHHSKHTLPVAIIVTVGLVFCAATIPSFGGWMLVPYLIVAISALISERQYGY